MGIILMIKAQRNNNIFNKENQDVKKKSRVLVK